MIAVQMDYSCPWCALALVCNLREYLWMWKSIGGLRTEDDETERLREEVVVELGE